MYFFVLDVMRYSCELSVSLVLIFIIFLDGVYCDFISIYNNDKNRKRSLIIVEIK